MGAYHFARLTGQRPVGHPRKHGTTSFDQTAIVPGQPRGMAVTIFYSFFCIPYMSEI